MVVVNKGEDLLPGFRFTPTEEELVGFFLFNKVMQPLQFDCYIEEKNIYADAPWDVFTDNQDWSKLNDESAMNNNRRKTQFYAFAKLKKNGKNVVRSAGCGKWHGQTGPKPVKNEYDNEIIGWKKMLTFEKKNGDGASKLKKNEGRWIMHEYSLNKDFLKKWLVVFSDHEELVICHITRYYGNKLLVDDHPMEEGNIAALNIQENPGPPLLIEHEANGFSCFLIQQEDDNDDQAKEDEDSKIVQDCVSKINGPIQENFNCKIPGSYFDFNLHLAELKKLLLRDDDDIPSDNRLGKRNSTTEEENPHGNKKSRL